MSAMPRVNRLAFKKLVALYRKRQIILENRGLAVADTVAKPASAPPLSKRGG